MIRKIDVTDPIQYGSRLLLHGMAAYIELYVLSSLQVNR
jgi:hypothetical protein